MNREPLGKDDFRESLKKGKAALSGYYDAYSTFWNKNIINELKISGIMFDNIRLTGALDKVEIVNSRNEVIVTDYKTRKPISRNELEGKTKGADGNYKRQLLFYNLLLNRFDNGKYRMIRGDIDFIEPDENRRYRRESFEMIRNEVRRLEEVIRGVIKEIMELKFWDRRCDDKECKFCKLRETIE